ncbi:MAG: EsaB/YukD family protein [Lachnospiraceae bacterium]|nr:EsaB/YukD family protein [Lachnospiraceae bacterium]
MIMVDIYFPAVDQTFSLRLDENVKISALIQEINEMMCKKYRSTPESTADRFMLCSLQHHRLLPDHTTLAENGILNGEKLIMV